jgi:predicted DNA-binding protein
MKVTELRKREYLKCPFNLRISTNMKEHLQELSDEYGVSSSYIARQALSQWLNDNDNE